MASVRRGFGVGAIQKKNNIQAKFQTKGDQLASDQLQQFASQLDIFVQKLEEFAVKHRDEIRKNSQFRRHFQEMCTTVGVDPLASSKGFWAEKLGVGDFYYELAVQIIEVCLATSHLNGGLITVDDLRNRLLSSRFRARKDPISYDDVIRAVKKLKVLGHGFELIALAGGRFLVQSVPGELSMDDARVLQVAEEAGGYVSSELIADHLRWDVQRIERVLSRLVKDGRAWIDDQPVDNTIHYWFPALFIEQYSQTGFSASASDCGSTFMEQQQPSSSATAVLVPNITTTTAPVGSKTVAISGKAIQVQVNDICQWIIDLADPTKRENALLQLSKRREAVDDLAVWLWYSYGTVSILLQEIITIYPFILPPTLTASQSNRVCNALALMQCIASHKDTRKQFLDAKIPLFLYPFLHTTIDSRPFEYLRLTSLGVLGALVKTDEKEVVKFLLSTEIIPLCLRIMEQGTELSRTVATFILQKVLLDDVGLSYVCQTYERFSHVAMVLGKMVIQLAKEPSQRLLKHVVRCYHRLSENNRALQALVQCLPDQLKDDTFKQLLNEDRPTMHWWKMLMKNLNISVE